VALSPQKRLATPFFRLVDIAVGVVVGIVGVWLANHAVMAKLTARQSP
jgi:hypothetical protein